VPIQRHRSRAAEQLGAFAHPGEPVSASITFASVFGNQLIGPERRMLSAHPWVAPLVGSRPPLLPGFLRYFDASLQALLDAGLEISDAATVSATLNAFVIGYALLEHSEHEARRRTDLNKRQWRARNAPLANQILQSGHYPAVAQYVGHAPDIDPDTAFDYALTNILHTASVATHGSTGLTC
jgi:Tetracyclin repressor-like, C-terminal domain